MSDKLLKLLRGLYQKTIAGEANWEKSSSGGEYVVKLRSGAVTVEKSPRGAYGVRLFNSDGERIDGTLVRREAEQHSFLKKMYTTVDRDYRKVDETIDSMIEEVEGGKPLGLEET